MKTKLALLVCLGLVSMTNDVEAGHFSGGVWVDSQSGMWFGTASGNLGGAWSSPSPYESISCSLSAYSSGYSVIYCSATDYWGLSYSCSVSTYDSGFSEMRAALASMGDSANLRFRGELGRCVQLEVSNWSVLNPKGY